MPWSLSVATVAAVAGTAGKPCLKCYVVFAATIVVVLATTGVWNPFPALWRWVNQSAPLATPAVAWQQRLGGTPVSVTVVDNSVVVEHRTTVEARGLAGGVRLWERDADWAAVAGDGDSAVVVTGELLVKGYDVVDPNSGAVHRHDAEAVAVWTFRDGLLDVRCGGADDCTLSAWDARGAQPRWRAQLPGIGFVLFADNPDVPDVRPLTVRRVEPDAAGPGRMPNLIGIPIDGRIHVVDTGDGQVVRELEPDRSDRVVVAEERVVRVRAQPRDGVCVISAEGVDAVTGQPVWRRDGLNLRTVDGGGCVQRDDPTGHANVLVAVAADGRQMLLDAYDGRALWTGRPGERVVATDSRHALIRSGGDGEGGDTGGTVSAVVFGEDGTAWKRPVSGEAQAALARHAAVIVDRDPDELVAFNPRTGAKLLDVRTSAKVAAVGPKGLVLTDGREIGYAPFAGSEGKGDPAGTL